MSFYYTPIYDSLVKYSDSKPVTFHMPGHKLGKGIPARFLKSLHLLDVTEIPGTDNLHFPMEAIKEAQELAAEAFGAMKTFFLVNGSTCGVHAMLMTVCRPGDKLIVARDCHRSVIGGMLLARVRPVYVMPGYNKAFGIPSIISAEAVETALKEHPEAIGVFITRPNYYGVCSDIEEIARIVHSYGKLLLVDEAHGSHLRFSEKLPVCAMDAGADMCVQSAHKTLPAFTQSAYLHVGSDRIDLDKLRFNMSLLQTSSPSYILMAFLDVARAVMEQDGSESLGALLEDVEIFDKELEKVSELTLLKDTHIGNAELDKTRVVIKTSAAGLTGYETERILREEFNIQVEMSDYNNIVGIATISDTKTDLTRLSDALGEISKSFSNMSPLADINIGETIIPEQKIALDGLNCVKGRSIPFQEAEGFISLGLITPYPPGIPLICPGEIITGEVVEYINNIIEAGGNITGLSDSREIKVVI